MLCAGDGGVTLGDCVGRLRVPPFSESTVGRFGRELEFGEEGDEGFSTGRLTAGVSLGRGRGFSVGRPDGLCAGVERVTGAGTLGAFGFLG